MSSELIENRGQQRHAINGLVVFNLNCCIFELNIVVFSLKNLPVKSKWTREEIKTRRRSIQHAWRFNQWEQLKTAPLWTFMSASLVYARAAFLRNSCPHIPLQWSTGCYRWSLDSAHMVPRWSQQSLGGHTWVNLSKVKGSLNMVTEGHFFDALHVIEQALFCLSSSSSLFLSIKLSWSLFISAEYNEL